jgi:hypothetical protein
MFCPRFPATEISSLSVDHNVREVEYQCVQRANEARMQTISNNRVWLQNQCRARVPSEARKSASLNLAGVRASVVERVDAEGTLQP